MEAVLAEIPVITDLWNSTIGDLWDSTDVFRTQYFDFNILTDNDWENAKGVLEGFWETIQLSVIAGILSLAWGLCSPCCASFPEGRWPRSAGWRSPTSTPSAASHCCWCCCWSRAASERSPPRA